MSNETEGLIPEEDRDEAEALYNEVTELLINQLIPLAKRADKFDTVPMTFLKGVTAMLTVFFAAGGEHTYLLETLVMADRVRADLLSWVAEFQAEMDKEAKVARMVNEVLDQGDDG